MRQWLRVLWFDNMGSCTFTRLLMAIIFALFGSTFLMLGWAIYKAVTG